MIFARKEVSVWSKLVFSFMASDRDDFFAAIAYLSKNSLTQTSKIYQGAVISPDRIFISNWIGFLRNPISQHF